MSKPFRYYRRLWNLSKGPVDRIPVDVLWQVEAFWAAHGAAVGAVIVLVLMALR